MNLKIGDEVYHKRITSMRGTVKGEQEGLVLVSVDGSGTRMFPESDLVYATPGVDGHEECRSEVDLLKREHSAEVERLQAKITELSAMASAWAEGRCLEEDGTCAITGKPHENGNDHG